MGSGNRVWERIKKNWDAFWIGDEHDDSKKHLSQSDKRSLLYGYFVIAFHICEILNRALWSGQSHHIHLLWQIPIDNRKENKAIWSRIIYNYRQCRPICLISS